MSKKPRLDKPVPRPVGAPIALQGIRVVDDRIAVIVGLGEALDRPQVLAQAKDPVSLMAQAVEAAQADAGVRILQQLDLVDIIKHVSTPAEHLPRKLSEKLGLSGVRCEMGEGSGNGPLRELDHIAHLIQGGHLDTALICGGEVQWTLDQAAKQGVALDWMREVVSELSVPKVFANPLAIKYGLTSPAQVYPLYDNAASATWGQTPQEARQESATIWSRMSEVASQNPFAWSGKPRSAHDIAEPTKDNRLLAWPYSKFMVANPSVNQASAIIVTSLSRARQLGVPRDKMIFLHFGAAAREADDYLLRDRYDDSPSQNAVLRAALQFMGWERSRFDFAELYSCFPIVPKMARRVLSMPADQPLTVAGGLSFFGGPLHNYMSHATIAMCRKLRDQRDAMGLLYGQGGFVTKHHALVLSAQDAAPLPEAGHAAVQAQADQARGPIPRLLDAYAGPAELETFTVVHDRQQQPLYGTVLARVDESRRTLARVHASQTDTLRLLCSLQNSPVGRRGQIRAGQDGYFDWSFL